MADRTILLAQNKRHATRGLSVVNPQEFLAYQEDDDNLTYIVDMGSYLDGATIVLVTRTPTGVVISNASNTTTRLTQRLAGYGHVDFRVQTSAGDTEQFRVYIQPRAANPAFFLTAGSGGGITALDGDKGDVIVSSAGSTWTLDPASVASLNIFTDTLKGITPASGGGTTNFLRADGTWATPPGGGGGGGPVSDADYGDITVSSTGTVWTIDNNAVTLAKMADMATASLIYRKTAGTGDPEVQTLATLKTDLGLTGTNSGDQTITLTGDVTGSGTGSFATAIGAGVIVDADVNASAAIALSKLATQGARTFVANSTASTAVPTAISVATAQGMVGQFDTVSAVNSATIDAGVNHIRTAGYYANGDGGGALYKRSTGTPTGVGTRYITSNSGTVVWELEPSNFINVRALGASPSASAADNTAAINAAMALGPAYIPPGTYNYTQVGATGVAFTLAAGYQLLATPREVTLVGASGTYETFRVTGSNTRVEGVDFNDASKTAGAFHHIQCGTSGIEETRVTNMIVYRSTGGATDSGATTAPYGTHTKTYWEDVIFLGHRGPGFTYTRSFAFLTIGRKCVVDYPQTPTGSENHTAFDYNGANMPAGAGGLILGLEVLGTSGNATTTTSQKGFFIRNTAAVFLLNCRVDNVEGEGIRLENCNGVYLQDAHVGLCDSHSLIFKDTGYVFGTVSINGRRIAGGGTSKDGIRYEGGCQYHNIKPWIVDVKGNGINCTTTTDTSIHFHDMHIITCEGTGILTSTGGFLNFSDGVINMPGAVADYNLGSTNHKIWNVLLTSGSPASVNTPIAYNARGTEAVRISSAGDVAIGSNNPVGARLQASAAGNLNAPVLGSIGTAPNRAPFYLSNPDQSYGLVVGNSAADGHVWFQAQRVDSATTTYNITLNEAGGNVGIGMASPGHRLDVTGSARFNGNLGFYNATPVAQPNTTGTTTGFTAGTGTAVNDASTFTGGVGTRAYRISDIVKALKDLGLIASS